MPTKFHPRMIGEVAGCDSTGYRLIRIDRKVKNGYQARIAANGKTYSLGVFQKPELASDAYYDKSVELYGEFARRD